MDCFVGVSGFSYREWKGDFYPEKIKNDDMLGYYAERFSTVEINSSFYRLPKMEVLNSWRKKVPKGFLFALKSPRRLTHIKRLKDCDDTLVAFLEVSSSLKGYLGPLLFQLPPNFKVNLDRLEAFMKKTPRRFLSAWEFRHESWFHDEWEERRNDLFSKKGRVFCFADTEKNKIPKELPLGTAGYLRLRRESYSKPALKEWAALIQEARWEKAYVYFKHETKAPRYASTLQELLG